MLKAVVSFYDKRPAITVLIGKGEDLRAPRDYDGLRKAGWTVDEDLEITYKAYLAAKRQGDITADATFDSWVDSIAELEARPSDRDIKAAVALGTMTQEQADALRAIYGDDEGEAVTPLA